MEVYTLTLQEVAHYISYNIQCKCSNKDIDATDIVYYYHSQLEIICCVYVCYYIESQQEPGTVLYIDRSKVVIACMIMFILTYLLLSHMVVSVWFQHSWSLLL